MQVISHVSPRTHQNHAFLSRLEPHHTQIGALNRLDQAGMRVISHISSALIRLNCAVLSRLEPHHTQIGALNRLDQAGVRVISHNSSALNCLNRAVLSRL